MIRVRVPGGVCTPAQWLALDDIATRYGNDSLRLTTRQAFQFHGVIKRHLKTSIAAINDSLLDTLAACGDVNRNVMCSPNPDQSALHAQVYPWAVRISELLTPATRAYHEIWLDGERLLSTREDAEPIYGKTYLPRKFKTAVVIPPANDVDVFAHDLGFIAIADGGALRGFNVTVGGGMGMSDGEPDTYPRLADVVGFCRPEQVAAVAEHVVTLQRDYGDRSNRKHARLKYTIEDRGLEWFRDELESRLGFELEPAAEFSFSHTGDTYGWKQGLGDASHLTLFVENGRIRDLPGRAHLAGLRQIAKVHDGDFRLTPNQNLIIANVAADKREQIDALVREYGLDRQAASLLRRNAMACVAFPSCGLAKAEAERYLPDLIGKLEQMLARHGLGEEPIVIRMTGCPNGCARPYLAEIGLVGKAPGRYNLYLGAGFSGERLNKLYCDNATEEQILAALDPIFAGYVPAEADPRHFHYTPTQQETR